MSKGGIDLREALKHGVFAVTMGAVGAVASIALCLCTNFAFGLFQTHPWLGWGLPLFGTVSLLLYRACHLPLDLTTHDVMDHLREDRPVPAALAPGIAAGTCLTLLGGGSVGREAAALQMGASLGSLVSRPFHLNPFLRKHAFQSMDGYAAAAGMAATFSALFFSPLGSAVFVVEQSQFKRNISQHFISLLLTCLVAWGIAQVIGIGDVIEPVRVPGASWPLVGQ